MKRVADFLDRFCFGGIVAVAGVADETIAGADRVNNLRQVRRERDDPRHARGQGNTAARVVGQRSCHRRIRLLLRVRSASERAGEDERERESAKQRI